MTTITDPNLLKAMQLLQAKKAGTAVQQSVPPTPAPEPAPAPAANPLADMLSLLPSAKPIGTAPLPEPKPLGTAGAPVPVELAELLAQATANRAAAKAAEPAPIPGPYALPGGKANTEPFREPAVDPQLAASHPKLVDSVRTLAQALHDAAPGYTAFLQDIHTHLRAEPELIHILTDDQRAAIYQANLRQRNVEIVAAKTKTKATAAVLKQTVDDSDM